MKGGSAVSLGSLFQWLELSCHHIPEPGFFPRKKLRTQFLLASLDSFLSAFLNCRIPAPWCGSLLLGPAPLGVGSAALRKGWFPRILWLWHFMIGRIGLFFCCFCMAGTVETVPFNPGAESFQSLCFCVEWKLCSVSVCISYFNISHDVFFSVLSVIKSFGEFVCLFF